jgi:hypothetical protein
LSRVINPHSISKERKQYIRAIVLALGELMNQREPDDETRDLVAFIALTLDAVTQTVEKTILPWEKRGYWLKADRFQQEWAWAANNQRVLVEAARRESWAEIAQIVGRLVERLSDVQLPKRHNLGRPWEGAWAQLFDEQEDGRDEN